MKCELKKQIYLDNNATTQLDKDVLDKMMPYLTDKFGNASSLHFFGQETRTAVEKAREQVAKSIGCLDREIFFTSGGTEADNWFLKGIAFANKEKGRHIITSAIEHHAVLDTCKYLGKHGFEITYLPVNKKGAVNLEDLKKAIKKDTILVSIMFANNETGVVQPIKEIGKFLKDLNEERAKNGLNRIFFHSDAVQVLGKMKIDVKELNLDAVSLSSHKIYGPKGVGALYIKLGTKIDPFMHGGAQEKNRRAGTENVAGIVGFGASCEKIEESIKEYSTKVKKLRDKLYSALTKNIPDVYLNGDLENSLPNTLNLSFKYIEGEGIILLLNCKGVAVSSGSACTSGSLETSHVLKAMQTDIVCAQGSIRFSLGKYNTEEDIEYVADILPGIVEKLRKMSPLL